MQNNKLSARFSTAVEEIQEPQIIEEPVCEFEPERTLYDVLSDLLYNKIYPIPVWADYNLEEQRKMVEFFVRHNATKFDEALIDKLAENVVGFGPVQYLLNNERVSAVCVNFDGDIQIVVDGKVLNTEIKLSEAQLNFVLKIANSVSSDDYIIEKSELSVRIQKAAEL